MRKSRCLLPFFFFITLASNSQTPAETLNRLSNRLPIEKAYLHLDRDDYLAGNTIWFKAYLYSDYYPDTISTILYVELLNDKSILIDRKILPVFFGNAFGQFELQDSLQTGTYLLRAYSPTMLNHDPEFIYKRNVFVFGKKVHAANKPIEKQTKLNFFPEGGTFLGDKANTIAFKATDELGNPVPVSGKILNEQGEAVAAFKSVHDGMGMFDLLPASGTSYVAVLDNDAAGKKYNLPAVQEKGIVFRLMPDPLGVYYEISQKKSIPDMQAAYMVGQMQHHVVFAKDFKTDSEWITGVVNTGKLNSGILQITVFNKDWVPLAERLCFINNKEYRISGQIVADTLNLSPKAKNKLFISMPDTVVGSFSVSITDPDYSLNEYRQENIISRLLLTEDLKGYIHNPGWYFSSESDSVKNALDLLMMTHGWRRFTWTALKNNTLPAPAFRDPGYISLSGRVNIRDTKKPVTNTELILLISSADSSSNSMQMLSTDPEGRFRLDSLIFFDRTRMFFNDTRGKKSKWVDVYLDGDSISKPYKLPFAEFLPAWLPADSSLAVAASKWVNDYDAILKENGLMLQGVTVKSKKKSPIQELEEKYASGLFSGFSERTLDLLNTQETTGYRNIFDFLRSRVSGLQVLNNGLDYTLYYRQTATLSSMGAIPMTIFLNEIETDASIVSTIPADMVAMVKVYSHFVGAAGNGPGGVLAIYTRKDADLSSVMPSRGSFIQYKGFSVLKEFYAPDYTRGTNLPKGDDHRLTLNWQPDLFIQAIDPKVPIIFHNTDRSRRFKVVVEGMTIDGKLLFIEKIFPTERKAF